MSTRIVTRVEQIRSWGLLEMRYQPSELAEELGCDVQRVYRVLLPAGAPHERDEAGHLWIVGTQFREWANRTLGRVGDKLADGQGYCLRCRAAVQMVGGEIKPMGRAVERIEGTCAKCGATVNRMRAKGAA
jgi:hypothetical protein